MNTTVITFKTEPKTKIAAQKLAKQLGVSVSSLVDSVLKDVIKTKSAVIAERDEIPNKRLRAVMKKAQANRIAGKGSPLFTSDKALIKKDPKKYQHIDTMEQWFNEQGI